MPPRDEGGGKDPDGDGDKGKKDGKDRKGWKKKKRTIRIPMTPMGRRRAVAPCPQRIGATIPRKPSGARRETGRS